MNITVRKYRFYGWRLSKPENRIACRRLFALRLTKGGATVMLNIVLEFDNSNLNPVLESFGLGTKNYVIPRESSEAVIMRIFEEMSRGRGRRKTEISLSATRCGETRFFPVGEIYYMESFRNLVCIFSEKGSFEFYSTLYRVEEATRRLGFFRVSNSYIISLAHVRKVQKGYVQLDNGKEISIGRKYRNSFREAVTKKSIVRLK